MSAELIDVPSLRARLEHTLRSDVAHTGTLYVRALACCYLAAPDKQKSVLGRVFHPEQDIGRVFHLQCEAEWIDSDDVLTELCLVEVMP